MNHRSKVSYLIVHSSGVSYTEANRLLQEGYVELNGTIIRSDEKTGPYDNVTVNGQHITKAHLYRYYMWHKPTGVECTFHPQVKEGLLFHLPHELKGMYHVGRLDKCSSGLLLFTNDGHLHDRLLYPQNKVPKTYEVQLERAPDSFFIEELLKGVELSGKIARVDEAKRTGENTLELVLTQGLNRQIRRMCHKLGNYVTALHRTSFSRIQLGDLPERDFRKLNRADLL